MARNNGNGTAVLTRGKSSRISSGTTKGKAARGSRKGAARGKAGKRVYFFGNRKAEGGVELKELLGGKGANLADMTRMGLPVPPGFTITTETCAEDYDSGPKRPPRLLGPAKKNLARVGRATKEEFGDPQHPALRGVRSVARARSPG